MSEIPRSPAGDATERLMGEINQHLKENDATNHHYNRTFEAVYRAMRKAYGEK